MAIEIRLEKNEDGGFSIIWEDKDNSGDLNRIVAEMCKKHKEAKEEKDLKK